MAGPFDVQVPAWLQRDARPIAGEEVGSLVGTALAGGIRSLTENKPFTTGYQEVRMTQQDPMWPLKVKQVEAQIQNARTLTTAKWLDFDRKQQQAQWQEDSLIALQGYDGSTPVPEGIKDIRVLNAANKMRADYVSAQFKSQDLENKIAATQARLDNQSQMLGIAEQRVKLAEAKNEIQRDLGQQRIDLGQAKLDAQINEKLPEPEVKEIEGKKFLFLGKNRPIELSATTQIDKARLSIVTENIKTLNRQIANPDNRNEKIQQALKAQLDGAMKELMSFATQHSAAAQEPRVRKYNPATDTLE